MDGARFDGWIRRVANSVRSRRGLLHLTLAAGAATIAAGALPEAALACRKNGRDCDPDKTGQCCSGKCKRTKNGGRCRPIRSALGCTINDDVCASEETDSECPGNPEGSCVVLDSGKPLCIRDGICADCESDRDCKRLSGGIPGKCIKRCRACQGEGSKRRACVFVQDLSDPMAVTRMPAFR